MKFKFLVFALSTTVALVGQQVAYATTFNLGTLNSGTGSFNELVSTLSPNGSGRSFTDTFTFTVDADLGSLSFSIGDFERASEKGSPWRGYSALTLTGAAVGFSFAQTGNTLTVSSSAPLSAGFYSLTLIGSDKNITPDVFQNRIRYDVSYNAIASPVPEPETYALMLAGLGLVGWAARRRKTAASAPLQAQPA